MTFGEKLKEARKGAGYSQEELANKLGVSRSAITKWETDKGMPDISNIKAISQLLNISIDYLLDDGSKLDFTTIRKPIDLSAYTDKKLTAFNKYSIKNKIIFEEFEGAEICNLQAEEKLTKGERIVDEAITWFTAMLPNIGVFDSGADIAKSINNINNVFYLVNKNDKQYFVLINDEYMEIKELVDKITEKKFEIGNYKFKNVGPIKNK
ncbi:MAG: helix-turn-helix transcriptional regulator [Lachnospiraceae bacterium]|nr:helix-turn-helix transcriptional regulator [Lachnospiraceae bacterium]